MGRARRLVALAAVGAVALAGCGSGSGRSGGAEPVRLYTSATQETVDALVAAYHSAHPDARIDVFRAPTGQLSARIASERRQGGVRADVLLLSDPLSMQAYAEQRLLLHWTPPEESAVPAAYRTGTFWGVSTLDVVLVHHKGLRSVPTSWADLTKPAYRNAVAIPDPGFAGSAFGALGYFALAPGYGLGYYRALKRNGAVQVQAPGDVTSGVAAGRFKLGMTLDFVAAPAIKKGAPLVVSTPAPGAIAVYGPVAVVAASKQPAAAEALAGFLLTTPAQEALARLGRHPVRADVTDPAPPARAVAPDWPAIFQHQQTLLSSYRRIFGG